MSSDPDRGAACPKSDNESVFAEGDLCADTVPKKNRSVRFPDENQLVTEYFEPANPWHNVPTTSRSQLAQEYLLACRRHDTAPIDSVLQQIRELPEASIGGSTRAARLCLADCTLRGAAPADALESLLRKVQFRRVEIDHAEIDDEGAEALFDMIEYYESACIVSISGPRHFGIRGWQAASRMIKKSAELSEIELAEGPLEASHAPVLARSLRPHTCGDTRLRALCLQRAMLTGEALMCLVIALKSNGSIRELRLPDNNLTPHDAQQLGSLLRFNSNIQLLDLSNNHIQDTGVGHIADALVEQSKQTPPSAANSPISPQLHPLSSIESRGLAFLVLWNNELTRNCAPHLIKALRASKSLCVLNVGRNALGAGLARALGQGARGALLSLGLQAARLGPDAAPPLADLLRGDTKLQRLDLRDNRLGPEGLQTLLTAMEDNHTLTQIDLDDPPESSSLSVDDGEAATVARLTRSLRALCRRNEPRAGEPERSAHRKISLTCHTACVIQSANTNARARLRSPLPSPAGSPTPHHNVQVNRFSVTRVTPDRESSSDSPSPSTTRASYSPGPSRFKVMQVTEPPSIQVHPAQKRAVSRFSVTRNYDSIYNPSPRESPSASPTPSMSPTPSTTSPSPSVSPCPSDNTDSSKDKNLGVDSTCASRTEIMDPKSEDYRQNRTEISETNPRTESCITPKSEKYEANTSTRSCIDTSRSEKENPRTESIETPRSKKDGENLRTEICIFTGTPNPRIEPRSETPEPRSDIYTGTPRSEKGYIYTPRKEKAYTETSRCDKDSFINSPDTSIDSISSDIITTRDYARYETPSITTLSGALFNKITAPVSCLKSSIRSKSPSPSVSNTRSEPVFGPALFVECTVPPTAVPNSRFSISPSPVSFLSGIETFYTRPQKAEDSVDKSNQNVNTNESFLSNNDFDLTKEKSTEIDVSKTVTEDSNTNKVIDTQSEKNNLIQNKSLKDKDICEDNANIPQTTKAIDEVKRSKVTPKSDLVKTERTIEEVKFFIADEPIYRVDVDSVSSNKSYSEAVKNPSKVECDSEKTDANNSEVSEVIIKSDTAKVHSDKDYVDDILKDDKVLMKIETITEGLGNLIKEMKVMSAKKKCVDVGLDTNIVPGNFRDVVLKKNKSESSLDSPDFEVSRLMNKKLVGSPFRDSNSSLEISGSSMESLNALENVHKTVVIQETVQSDTELDRRKDKFNTESSVESTSEVTPVTQNFLTTSVSSNESVSPIFGKGKKTHGSLSSLEASVSSIDSKQDKIMVTSADSGIEHSLQNPSENNDASSNEGTLTHNSSLKDTIRSDKLQETLTSSPKRTSSLLDVPALKTKGLDRMRKISWVAPSPSFHIPREQEKVKEEKQSHLEKLLSLFQHPASIFRSQSDDERKSASSTPPRKDSTLTSSFWSWGSAIENYREDKEDTSETTDSTLSERVQVSFVDESFSKKLDSKTPSTDTDNTLSEFQFSNIETTDLVQKLEVSDVTEPVEIDLKKPNDNQDRKLDDVIQESVRPRSFAAVLKATGSENSIENQISPEGQTVEKLPVKVIRGIKENISPENTLTSSVTNTQALAIEMRVWEVPAEKNEPNIEEVKSDLAPIATIEETCDIAADNFSSELQLAYIDDVKVDIQVRDNPVTDTEKIDEVTKELDAVDLGKDALSYLMYEGRDFEAETDAIKAENTSLAQELKDAEIKEMIDLSPELVIDEAIEVFPKQAKPVSPVIPDRAKIKSNSLEDLSQREEKCPKAKCIAFKVPETSPCDIPARRTKLRSRSGTSPKSLPESLNKPCPLSKMDSILTKKKKRVSSLGKMARDSLLALNMSEEEIAEFRRSYKLTSVESLRSLESVSEDANSQSGASFDSRCRSCLHTSQESLMSLDSVTEDCRCENDGREKRTL